MLLSISSRTNSYLQFLSILILFIFVLGITWLTTRWIAKIQHGQMSGGTNLEVIETQRIANNKYIQIVRVGKKYIAIAQGKDEVCFLTQIDEEDIKIEEGKAAEVSFSQVFEKIKKLNGKSGDAD